MVAACRGHAGGNGSGIACGSLMTLYGYIETRLKRGFRAKDIVENFLPSSSRVSVQEIIFEMFEINVLAR